MKHTKWGKIPCYLSLVVVAALLMVFSGCGSSLPKNSGDFDEGDITHDGFLAQGTPPTGATKYNFRGDMFRERLTNGAFAEQLDGKFHENKYSTPVNQPFNFGYGLLAGYDYRGPRMYFLNDKFYGISESMPRFSLVLRGKATPLSCIVSDWRGYGYDFSLDIGMDVPTQCPSNLGKLVKKTFRFQPNQTIDLIGKTPVVFGQVTNYYFNEAKVVTENGKQVFSLPIEFLQGGTFRLLFSTVDNVTSGVTPFFPKDGKYSVDNEAFDTIVNQPKAADTGDAPAMDVETLTNIDKMMEFALDNEGHVVHASVSEPNVTVWLEQAALTSQKSAWCLPNACSVVIRTNLPNPTGQVKDMTTTCVQETGNCSVPEFSKVPDGTYQVSAIVSGQTERGGLRVRLGAGDTERLECLKSQQGDGVFIFEFSIINGQFDQCENSALDAVLQ